MENNQSEFTFPTALNLNDPKNQLQYQLYKTTLALEVFAEAITPVFNQAVESFNKIVMPIANVIIEYQRLINLGASKNPRLAYFAYHAKTRRARKKNLNRLYKLGRQIEKRGVHHYNQRN